jgi:NADH-quinone oxidoreductase subunit J
MTPDQIIFLFCAALIVSAALMVVTTQNLVHAALWLVATLFGVAILFGLLQAGFLALVQVVVYIGAIAILFIFAVMLTRREMRDKGPQLNKNWVLAAILGLLTFGGLTYILWGWVGFSNTAAAIPAGTDTLSALGNALVLPNAFLLPFEVASILLLAALVGAVYIASASKK